MEIETMKYANNAETSLAMLIEDILKHSKEKGLDLANLPDVKKIVLEKISSSSIFKNVETQIINMSTGKQLMFEIDAKEIIACLILSGKVVIGPWLNRLKAEDSIIINYNVPEEKAANIAVRAIQTSKLLLIAATY
jgi:PHP family Zn ribbon phosphoesterase